MRTALAAVLLAEIIVFVSSCQKQAPSEPQPALHDASPRSLAPDGGSPSADIPADAQTPDSSPEAEPDAPEGEAPAMGVTTPVGSWGITITVPPEATSEHEAHASRHNVSLSRDVSVTLNRVDAPGPASLDEAMKVWGGDIDSRELGKGATPSGVFYVLRELRVRVGYPGVPGQTIHTWEQVSRVYAVLALDAKSHVRCTGYVEHGASSAADPDLRAVRDICLSMRKQNAGK